MPKFREINYQQDVDEIVKLLNANFETHHSKEAFLWKHYENPFGKSYGLLAIDNNRIVGLRMFMRWEFLCDNRVVKAICPVDTCTDHDYRGRGLFKKLTLEGLDKIKDEYELIFNTPNEKSKPGYLKMGWKVVEGDFQYKVGIVNFLKKASEYQDKNSKDIEFDSTWPKENSCQTNLSKKYLEWRFMGRDYRIAEFPKRGIVIYKLTQLRGITTVVLIDVFGEPEEYTDLVTSVCIKNRAKAVYFLENIKNSNLKFLLKFDRGHQTVVSKDDKHDISSKIKFSVGDLEGRL